MKKASFEQTEAMYSAKVRTRTRKNNSEKSGR